MSDYGSNGAGGYASPPTRSSMGPPQMPPPSRSSAANSGYASMTEAGYALQQAQELLSHPPSKSATGGQSHSHRPVSAMPAPSTSSSSSGRGGGGAGGSSSAGASLAYEPTSYADRRASAHPTMSSSTTTTSGMRAPPMPVSPSGGMDAATSAALSSGIPITSPAALSYFAAHPRRQQVHFGNYLLLQTLGEGEFGKVKLGVHKEWGEEVAVKLIKRDKVGTPDGQLQMSQGAVKDAGKMSKVEREIQVLKDVRHPNIVRLYEVIESDRYIGIVLEYASGGELFDHILAHKYLKERDACRLFAQLISGVWYLHQKKIVHRDLKLENLLLDRNRNVIITDFGFANNFGDKRDDLMATSCGSPCYAAPELVVQDGLYAGSAVDVWSCGVILYAMLAGYLPFDDDPANPDGDNINLLYKYIMATPLSFPDYITAEPRDLLSRMLVPDPTKRVTLEGVMSHSWLSSYKELFRFTVDELERVAIEQQTKKRQAYRQQIQYQAQQAAEQARSGGSSNRSKGSRNTAIGTVAPDSESAARASRHHSAMPTPTAASSSSGRSATSASDALYPPGSTPRARPTTNVPVPIVQQHTESVLPATLPLGNASSSAAANLAAPAHGQPPSATASVSPSPSRKRDATPSDMGENSPATKRTPASAKPQRHTIQLEYDDQASQRRERQAAAPAPMVPPVPPASTRSQTGSKTSAGYAESAPLAAGAAVAAAAAVAPSPAPASVIPAVPAVVPAAERVVTAESRNASRSSDVDVAAGAATSPSPSRSSLQPQSQTASSLAPLANPPANGSAVPGRQLADGSGSSAAAANVPSSGRQSVSGRGVSNPLPASTSQDLPFPQPPTTTSSQRRASAQVPSSAPVALSSDASGSPSRRNSSRHRKGMSTDKFFFSKLLGQDNGSSSKASGVNGNGAAKSEAGLPQNGSSRSPAVDEAQPLPDTAAGRGSNSRRKAMSLVVGRRDSDSSPATRDREKANQTAAAAKAAKQERRLTGRLRKQPSNTPSAATAPGGTPQATPSGSRITSSASTAQSEVVGGDRPQTRPRGASQASSRFEVSSQQSRILNPSVNGSSSTVGPSSGAAKKVMDWFRKKSLSRGAFDEQPPFEAQLSSRASKTSSPVVSQPAATPEPVSAPAPAAPAADAPPRVVVTGDNGAAAAAAGVGADLSSLPSSRSTSGTHSQMSYSTDTTALTSATETSHVKAGDAAANLDGIATPGGGQQQPTPKASASAVRDASGARTPRSTTSGAMAPSSVVSDASLRYHQGAVDQSALTSRKPHDVFEEVKRILFEMGIEARKEREEDFKLECVRRKRAKTLMGATQGLGLSLRTSVFPPSQADYERSVLKSPSSPPSSSAGGANGGGASSAAMSPSPSAAGPAGSIRSFLRRGSSQQNGPISPTSSTIALPSSAGAAEESRPLPNPLYGEPSIDGGQEVRFSVEVTRIKNLPGLYSLDIRRMKGNLWAYKFLYHALLERAHLAADATPRVSPVA